MAGSPQTVTLAANTVATLTLPTAFLLVEVMNVTGTAEVYFRFDGTDPTVGGDGCQVLPAAIGSVELRPETVTPTVVKLVSSGTPKVSVRGV
jgi:hypothetical protein